MADRNSQVAGVTPAGAVGAGLATEQAPLILALENIGPLKEARIELGRGLTVFYGLHSTGKTTVARVLRLLAKLNTGTANAEDVVKLVKRQLRYMDRSLVEKEGKVGRIVYNAELEIRCIPDIRGAKLKIGEWERYVTMDERLPTIDKPKIVLFWITHNSLRLYGVAEQKESLSMEELLTPSVFRGIVANIYDDAIELYEEVLSEVNNLLETIDYVVEYRDGVYFKHGIHIYTPDEVSSGIRRFTLILLATAIAKRFAEYAKYAEPVIFIENIEDSLDVTLMSTVIDILRFKDMISVAETHSGFPLRAATIRRNMNYYVFFDGRATKELTAEIFKREIEEWSDLNAL